MRASRLYLFSLAVIAVGATPVCAGLIGGNNLVSGSGAFPDVAYNSVNGNYLVVWYTGPTWGRLVDNNGNPIGSAFQISSVGGLFPAVAYNATNNEFLVTWDDQRASPFPIWGQRVRGSDGALLGGNFQISSIGLGRSAVAWSATSNSYLVIAFNWSEVYGQRVSNTGTLSGGTFNISNDAAFSGYPGVSWGSSSNQYLVTWDHDDGRIVGQRVNAANGALLGGQFTVLPSYSDRSASAYDTVNNRWMVEANYHDPVTSYDQRCQLVSASGTLIGGVISFASTTEYEGDSQYGGDICYIPGSNRFAVNTANSGYYEGQSLIEYNNATGAVISFKNLLGVGNFPSSNVAADSALNRYLSAWMVAGGGIACQLYGASATAIPGQASSPNPANGNVGHNANADLSWTAGSGATSRNIYFGTTNPPLIATTISGTTYDPGTLAWDTTYYWQVNEVNAGGTRQGPIWNFNTKSTVSINMGNTNIEDMMTAPVGGDGDTVGATGIAGHECRRNMDPGFNDHYFYFTVNDGWAFQGNKTDVWIAVEYYDNASTGAITLQYDAASSAYKDGGSVLLTGTNSWKWHKFHVTDAYFGNRENNSSDFRVHVGNSIRYLDNVNVQQKTPGTVPPGQASNPSPANGSVSADKNDDLSWSAGSGASSHNVYFGTTNPPAFIGVQTGTTYDPGLLTSGTTYYWRIDEYANSGGTTTGAVWSFTVRSEVSIDLGNTNVLNGMNHPVGGDGDTSGDTIGGRECRRNMDPGFNDAYFYFTIDNSYASAGNNPDQWISIEYYDNATSGTLQLQYDGASSIYTIAGDVALTGTNTWKKHTWHVTDGYFANRQTNGADLRIYTGGSVTRYLDVVRVSQNAPSPPLPGLASAPAPANAATGVSTAPTLSWTAGSNATAHIVHFGTTNPPAFIGSQGGTTYAPGTLSSGVTYYWRINEYGASGTTVGTVWSFTTGGLPGLATNPSPANAATGVDINADLSWTAGANATSRDVRFGTANPPPFIQNQTALTYDPGTLTAGTTYFWRIDEKNASGTTTGVVWNFTTLPLPGVASGPTPASGATSVSINADVSWTAGSNTTSHDVRFGTVNPPPFIQNQAGTTYDPGTMTAGTTYYWRIDEVNGSGTTTGTVWSFTTLPLPGLASAPSPANGANGVSITATLSWTAGSNAASHDVRFGTANPPPFIQNQAGTTYNPGTTNPSTTYYWRIDEVNASGTTTGTVWSFTTATPPAAPTVTGPANGSTATTLTPTITWTGAAHDGYQVRISQQNDSSTSTNGWDSGDVTSTGNSAVSGTLRNYSFYYVFVRLRNVGGWGAWSNGGYNFIINTNTGAGTVYLGNALPTASSWLVYDGTCENCTGITSTIVADGGSNVWKLVDAHTSNRAKLRYTNGVNIDFTTGASTASRMRATSVSGTPTYNLGISNGNVGGMFLRLYTNEVRLVDINGTNAGSYALDATVYHKYQLTVKNATAGNNATAAWKVYVDGTLRISWTGAGVHNGFDGFMSGHAGTAATGTWWFDNISGRSDGEFTPAQWDPVY